MRVAPLWPAWLSRATLCLSLVHSVLRCLAGDHRGAPRTLLVVSGDEIGGVPLRNRKIDGIGSAQAMLRRQFSGLSGGRGGERDERQMWEGGGCARILKRARAITSGASHRRRDFGEQQRWNNDRITGVLDCGQQRQALGMALFVWD